jgi:hypothetical protein
MLLPGAFSGIESAEIVGDNNAIVLITTNERSADACKLGSTL